MSATSPPPYENPQSRWVCGQTECGQACVLGPSRRGVCPESHPCTPILDGDQWKCMRCGGPCDCGPGADGACGLPRQTCAPVPSMRARRGGFIFATVATMLGTLAVVLTSPQRNEIIVPGGLTTAHAQILRQQGTRRCATCHQRGAASFAAWTASTAGLLMSSAESVGQSQTDLCMECHDHTIPSGWATAPHTVNPKVLDDRPSEVDSLDSQGEPLSTLACASCHREHHGGQHDLTRMTVQQCNVCHRQKCQSFADDHPEFGAWPYERRSRIRFTHATHQARYFPENGETFACNACHQTQAGSVVRSLAFEQACGDCHEQTIQRSFADGVDIIGFPMLDVEELADNGLGVGAWPSAARGDFDGELTPLVRLLLLADPEAQQAQVVLGQGADLMDADLDDLDHLEAISDLIWGYKRLLRDLAVGDLPQIKGRLETFASPHGTLPEPLVDALVRQLPYAEIKRSIEDWLPQLLEEVPPPPSPRESVREPATNNQRGIRDDVGLVVRIPPEGHASPFMRAWIELNLAMMGEQEQLDRTLTQRIGMGDCLSCHTIDETSDGLVVNWQATGPATHSKPSFTRFEHTPHLVLPELHDCTACHRLSSRPDERVYEGFSFDHGAGDFEQMSRAQCATCHNRQTKVDQCTLCHSYHGGQHPTPGASAAFKPLP